MKNISALFFGLLFGFGLNVSQMVNPQKVQNFLDIFGQWDPSLALVMFAALSTFGVGYRLAIGKMNKPILEDKFYLPTLLHIDKKLVIGAAIFGFGWGLSGICPGPAITNVLAGHEKIYGFILMMFIGFKAANYFDKPSHT